MDANGMMNYYGGLTPFETVMINEKSSRRPSGVAVAGLTIASAAALAGIGAWIFGPYSASQRARGIEAVVAANNNNTNATLDRLINALANERAERVAQGTTISQTITDTISGQQSSSLTAQQASELSAMQSLQQTLLTDAVTGRSSLNPTPVSIYSAPAPCGCPGCGCNN